MLKTSVILLFSLLHYFGTAQKNELIYQSENLTIQAVSEHSFVHISYLDTENFGRVACNGMIYMNNGEAIVFDTPVDKETSQEMLHWLTQIKKHKIVAVVVNHFHDDCLGGLTAFHTMGIPSYAHQKTIALAGKHGNSIPEKGFSHKKTLYAGNKRIVNRFVGEAHTTDNIISYIPSESLIFGGCMVKSIGASKGNLSDANESEWSNTIKKIKQSYPNLKTVIPGHGDFGGIALLDYTEKLFLEK